MRKNRLFDAILITRLQTATYLSAHVISISKVVCCETRRTAFSISVYQVCVLENLPTRRTLICRYLVRIPLKGRTNRGHQPFWNWKLLLEYRLMRSTTNSTQTSEMKFSSIHLQWNWAIMLLLMIIIYVKTLIMLML